MALAAALCASGCATIFKTNVDDLQLTGLSITGAQNPQGGSVSDPNSIRTYSSVMATPVPGAVWESIPNAPSPLLVVTLKSSYDVYRLSEKRRYFNLHFDARFCGSNDEVAAFNIEEDGAPMEVLDDARRMVYLKEHRYDDHSHTHVYRTVIHSKWNRGYERGIWLGQYDLAAETRDICMRLWAIPYLAVGIGLTSREVVIPNALIRSALSGRAVTSAEIESAKK